MKVAPELASLRIENRKPTFGIGGIAPIVNTVSGACAAPLFSEWLSNCRRDPKSQCESHARSFARSEENVVFAYARLGTLAVVFALAGAPGAAQAEMAYGVSSFSSRAQCASSGRFPAETCSYADANSAAEFEEKAPRFPSRAACERAFGPCSLGFRGADGWAGRRGAVYFTPRRQGFRITVRSGRDATVVPIGPGISFSPRSALRRDASINPRAPREYASPAPGGQPSAAFGVATPDGQKQALPPPPPVDPNFDCAAVLEPTDKGDANTGCYLAPSRKR